MSENPVRGTAILDLGDRKITLRYSWDAQAKIKAVLGDQYDALDPITLSQLIAIGAAEYHPDLTAEDVRKASPPLVSAMDAFNRAMSYALYGVETPPEQPTNP